MFLPRIEFASAESYCQAAREGRLRPGQYVAFDGIQGRFARSNGNHVTTFYWKTGARRAAMKYLRDHGKRSLNAKAH